MQDLSLSGLLHRDEQGNLHCRTTAQNPRKYSLLSGKELGLEEHTRLKLSHGVVVRVDGSQRMMFELLRRRRRDSADSIALRFSMIVDKMGVRNGSTLEKFGTLERELGLGPGLGDLDEGAECDFTTLDLELTFSGESDRRSERRLCGWLIEADDESEPL